MLVAQVTKLSFFGRSCPVHLCRRAAGAKRPPHFFSSFFAMTVPRVLFPALLGLLLAGPARAQNAAQAPADTARSYKYTFGLTASPVLEYFFTVNRSLPLGLLYKRQLMSHKALRLRLVGYYSRRDTSNYWKGAPTSILVGYIEGPNTTTWDVNAYVGVEWAKPLARRLYGAYGLELGTGWNRTHTDYLLQFSQPGQQELGVQTGTETVSIWSAQARPFVSLCYQFTKHLGVFVESAVVMRYTHRQRDRANEQFFYNGLGAGGRNSTDSALTVFWYPIQLVGTTFSF